MISQPNTIKNTEIIAWLTTLSGLATIMLFESSLTSIELSYFIRNFLTVVWATTKTVKGPSVLT